MRASPSPARVAWGRALIALGCSVLVQATVFGNELAGLPLRVDLPLLLVITMAMMAGPQEASRVGFVTGMTVDLFAIGPFGQHTFAYTVMAYAIAVAAGHRNITTRLATRTVVIPLAVAVTWILVASIGWMFQGSSLAARVLEGPPAVLAGSLIGGPVALTLTRSLGLVSSGTDRRPSRSSVLTKAGRPRFIAS